LLMVIAKIMWVQKTDKKGRIRAIPVNPKDGGSKHHYLRNTLMNNWEYSKHYVDSAIKQAYSILKSWRRSYLKGKRSRKKTTVKRRFVRVKEALYSFGNNKDKVKRETLRRAS